MPQRTAYGSADIERLNDVFGPCGIGWRYVHAPFEVLDTGNGRTEIVTEVALQYRFVPTSDCVGTGPVDWNAGWAICTSEVSTAWSEPVLACGGKSVGKGGAAFTDARKSAVTDGLTKAASMIGVGHQVFKGLAAQALANATTTDLQVHICSQTTFQRASACPRAPFASRRESAVVASLTSSRGLATPDILAV